jgi:hypothetical protein
MTTYMASEGEKGIEDLRSISIIVPSKHLKEILAEVRRSWQQYAQTWPASAGILRVCKQSMAFQSQQICPAAVRLERRTTELTTATTTMAIVACCTNQHLFISSHTGILSTNINLQSIVDLHVTIRSVGTYEL